MKRITALFVVIALCGLVMPSQSDGRAISISPRVAVPVGDFADVAGLGFGAAIAMDKEVKGRTGRVGLVFLAFGEETTRIFGVNVKTSAMGVGAFAGYKYEFGSDSLRLYGKADSTLYRLSSEASLNNS